MYGAMFLAFVALNFVILVCMAFRLQSSLALRVLQGLPVLPDLQHQNPWADYLRRIGFHHFANFDLRDRSMRLCSLDLLELR